MKEWGRLQDELTQGGKKIVVVEDRKTKPKIDRLKAINKELVR